MKKHLSTNGNTWQLYINKPISQCMGINKDEYTVSMVIKNKCLYIEKCNAENTNCLTKKMIKRSTGYGLNLSLPILELLDINPETDSIDIELDENKLIIKKSD